MAQPTKTHNPNLFGDTRTERRIKKEALKDLALYNMNLNPYKPQTIESMVYDAYNKAKKPPTRGEVVNARTNLR